MGKIIKYEITKFFSKRKNKLLILLLLAFIVFINIYNYQVYKKYNERIGKEYKLIAANAKSISDLSHQKLTELYELSEEEKFKHKEQILKLEGELNFFSQEANVTYRISNALDKVEDPEWNRLICKYLGQRYTNIVDSYESGYIDDSYLRERKTNIEEAKHYQYKYEYLLENNILLQLNEYEPSGIQSFALLLKGHNILIIMLIVALLSMDIFLSSVMEGSYKLEYTQPFERNKLFWCKVISILIIIIGVLSFIFLIVFTINSIIFGIGDFSYPHIVSDTISKVVLEGNQGSFTAIPLRTKLLLGVFMFISLLILTISLIFILSVFTDSMEVTLGISIVIAIAAFTFKVIATKDSIINFIYPYMYCYYESVISGFYRANYLFGIIMNSLLSISFILLSLSKFIKKDFLGSKV